MVTLEGHQECVTSLALLEGGQLASGALDLNVTIWFLATGTCVATHEERDCYVFPLAVLEGDRLASASGSLDRTMKILEITSGPWVGTLEGHGGWGEVLDIFGGRLAGERI